MVMAEQTGSPTLFPEIHEVTAPPGKGLHGYYRRRDGWITTGPTTDSNRADFEYMGYSFLSKYGQFKNVNDITHEVDINRVPWNSYAEAWRRIFQLGGAKEFPIDQIIAFRWHIRRPYKEVTFPQLEGVEIYDFYCPECDQGVFSSTNEREALIQLRHHLTTTINGPHSYRVEDLTRLGQEWGLDFFAQGVGRRAVRRSSEIQAEGTLEPPEAAPPLSEAGWTCRDCGQEFPSAGALGGHRSKHTSKRRARK